MACAIEDTCRSAPATSLHAVPQRDGMSTGLETRVQGGRDRKRGFPVSRRRDGRVEPARSTTHGQRRNSDVVPRPVIPIVLCPRLTVTYAWRSKPFGVKEILAATRTLTHAATGLAVGHACALMALGAHAHASKGSRQRYATISADRAMRCCFRAESALSRSHCQTCRWLPAQSCAESRGC
jgi:hypothetical protein